MSSIKEMIFFGTHKDVRSLLTYYQIDEDEKRLISNKIQVLDNLI